MIESNLCGSAKSNEDFVAGKAYRWLAIASGTLLAVDQLSKFAALQLIRPYQTITTPLGRLLRFTLIFNDGAAFGIMSGKRWLIVAIAILMSAGALFFWRSLWNMGKVARTAVAVVLAGSVGNMIDRIRLGSVVDFIEVPIVPLFQVFNFADAFIVLGSIVFIYAIFRAS